MYLLLLPPSPFSRKFLPHLYYQSSAVFISCPSFICHPFTSTIIPSPPVPSFASCSFCLPRSVYLCVSSRVTDWFSLCWFWWRGDDVFGQGKLGGDRQHSHCGKLTACTVHQTGLNQNHSPLSAAQNHQHPVLMYWLHPCHHLLSLWWYLTACLWIKHLE